MRLRWLGWAGIELERDGTTVVVDALADAGAVFAPFGERAAGTPLPEVTAPREGTAVAALVTHLHRDHADAAAISAALSPEGVLLEPPAPPAGRDGRDDLALAQAEHELAASGVRRRRMSPWESTRVGPFQVTALPAADGLGDPQVSWLVESGGVRVLHLGDTMLHGWWWRFAHRHGPFDAVLLPVNGAIVDFPHRQPAGSFGAAMDPGQAAAAARVLAPAVAVPIHAEGYRVPGTYTGVPDAAQAFRSAAEALGVAVHLPRLGAAVDLG